MRVIMVVGQVAIERRQPRSSNFGRTEAAWRDCGADEGRGALHPFELSTPHLLQPGEARCDFRAGVSRRLADRRCERFAQPLPIYGDLDAGAFLLQEHHDARVTSAPSACESLCHFGERKIAETHRHT